MSSLQGLNSIVPQLFQRSVTTGLTNLSQNDCVAWLAHSAFSINGFVCVQTGSLSLPCEQNSGRLHQSWNEMDASYSFVFQHDQLGDRVVLKCVAMFNMMLISCKLQNDQVVSSIQIRKSDFAKKINKDFGDISNIDQLFCLIDKNLIHAVTSRASVLQSLSSYASQVAAHLRIALNHMKLKNPNEAIFVACHCVMLVEGFQPIPVDHTDEKTPCTNVCKALNLCSLSSCSMCYRSPSHDSGIEFSMKGIRLLNNLLIYAKRKETQQEIEDQLSNPKYCLKISVSNHIDLSKEEYCIDSYKDIANLVSNVRNSIAKRLQAPFLSQNGVQSLPTDIMVETLRYLESSELVQVSKINRVFNILEKSDWLWKNLCERELEIDVSKLVKTRWKLEFIARVLTARKREKELAQRRASRLLFPGWDPFSPFAPLGPRVPWPFGPHSPPQPIFPRHPPTVPEFPRFEPFSFPGFIGDGF